MSCDIENLQLGAIGAVIVVTVEEDGVAVNLSGVSTKSLVFRRPDRTSVTKTADFFTDGTDGKLKYVTESGFLDVAGWWKIQAYLQFPGSGYDGHSEAGSFQVVRNI